MDYFAEKNWNVCLLLVLLLLIAPHPAQGQQGWTVNASLTIGPGNASCTIQILNHLDYGEIFRPIDKRAHTVNYDPVNNKRVMHTGLKAMAVPGHIGSFSVTGENTNQVITSFSTLSSSKFVKLSTAGSDSTIVYQPEWAQSSSSSSGFSLIAGSSYTFHLSGTEPQTHYFRLGGKVDGIISDLELGLYEGRAGHISTACE